MLYILFPPAPVPSTVFIYFDFFLCIVLSVEELYSLERKELGLKHIEGKYYEGRNNFTKLHLVVCIVLPPCLCLLETLLLLF